MSQRGRPKSDEPLIGRNFNLPISLNEELVETSRSRKISQVQIVREGVQLRLDVLNGRVGTGEDDPFFKILYGGEESARPLPDGRQQYTFNLIEEDAKELEKLAGALYMDDPQLFVKILTRAALDAGPEAVKKLLYGQFDADVDAHIAAKEEAVKSKKVSRKAA